MAVCIVCGGRAVRGRSRCSRHGPTSPRGPSPYNGAHQHYAKQALAQATHCWICGGGPREGDPFQADHIQPLSLGGKTEPENYAAAHRSCNVRRGGANR